MLSDPHPIFATFRRRITAAAAAAAAAERLRSWLANT